LIRKGIEQHRSFSATLPVGGVVHACKHPRWLRGLLLSGLLATAAFPQPAPSTETTVRLGFSARDMGNTNRADVTAAMKAWLQTVTRERNLIVDTYPEVFDSVGDMANALRHERIDVIIVPTDQFVLLEKIVPLSSQFASKVNGKISEQYVVLVQKDRPYKTLKDLRGETIIEMDHPRNSLAPLWLDAELLRNRLPVAARFFGKVTHATKLNLAVLPVFFKQAGAALVSRSNFETAGELNPQLSKELRVLASSQDLIPSLTAYRVSASSIVVDNYRKEALRLGETPAGKLILDLFQTDGVMEVKESDLAGTRAFLAEYARLKTEAERKGAGP
jgi:ABC-type phosphate/phosphonate transport system substrate-binding protein